MNRQNQVFLDCIGYNWHHKIPQGKNWKLTLNTLASLLANLMDPMWMFMFLFQSSLARLLLLKLLAPLNCWPSSSHTRRGTGKAVQEADGAETNNLEIMDWILNWKLTLQSLTGGPHSFPPPPPATRGPASHPSCLVPASHLPLYKTTSCTLSRPACNTFF